MDRNTTVEGIAPALGKVITLPETLKDPGTGACQRSARRRSRFMSQRIVLARCTSNGERFSLKASLDGGPDESLDRDGVDRSWTGDGFPWFDGSSCTCSKRDHSSTIEFEVASIKPTLASTGVREACRGIDSRFAPEDTGATVPLGRCVVSCGRRSHAGSGVPDRREQGGRRARVGEVRRTFRSEAKAENPARTTEAQLIAMLQKLLVDRFKLKLHREVREMPGFALVVAKSGAKLRSSENSERKSTTSVGTRASKLIT